MPFVLAFGVGTAAGLWMSGSATEIATAAKWVAGAAVIYVGAKALKVI